MRADHRSVIFDGMTFYKRFVLAALLAAGAIAPAATVGAETMLRAPGGEPCEAVATADAYETPGFPVVLRIDPPGVKANDTHCNLLAGPALIASVHAGAGAYNVRMETDGSFTYTPPEGFTGIDTFNYALQTEPGPNAVAFATVTIAVTSPPSCIPVAVDDDYSTSRGVMLDVGPPGVLDNDTHCDLSPFVTEQPTHGTVVFADDGSFQYMPTAGFTGVDMFEYLVTTGPPLLVGDYATVTITVTGPPCEPVAVDDTYETPQNVVLDIGPPGVKDNDTPCGWDNVAVVNEPTNGTLAANADGSFQYTPNAGFTGVDTYDYVLFTPEDHEETDPATVTITVTEPPCAPTAADDAYDASQDGVLDVAPPGVKANDEHCDVLVEELTTPQHGTLTLNGDGSFQYTPNPGYAGPDVFEYALAASPSGFARSASGFRAARVGRATAQAAPSDTHIGEVTITVTSATDPTEPTQPTDPTEAEPPAPMNPPIATDPPTVSTDPPAATLPATR